METKRITAEMNAPSSPNFFVIQGLERVQIISHSPDFRNIFCLWKILALILVHLEKRADRSLKVRASTNPIFETRLSVVRFSSAVEFDFCRSLPVHGKNSLWPLLSVEELLSFQLSAMATHLHLTVVKPFWRSVN
jgi:hypothetical protein